MRATKPAYAIHFMIYNTYLAKGENNNIYKNPCKHCDTQVSMQIYDLRDIFTQKF